MLEPSIQTLRTIAASYQRMAELALALIEAPSNEVDVSLWHALLAEAQSTVAALELAIGALETTCSFTRDSDGPPLCPFCKMPYRPTPYTKGIVS
jgi:hypothetical protein